MHLMRFHVFTFSQSEPYMVNVFVKHAQNASVNECERIDSLLWQAR